MPISICIIVFIRNSCFSRSTFYHVPLCTTLVTHQNNYGTQLVSLKNIYRTQFLIWNTTCLQPLCKYAYYKACLYDFHKIWWCHRNKNCPYSSNRYTIFKKKFQNRRKRTQIEHYIHVILVDVNVQKKKLRVIF